MADSNVVITPGTGGPSIDLETVDTGNSRQVVVIGDPSTGSKVAPVDATLGLSVNVTNTTSPLPTGASTAANQATEIASLSTIATNTPAVGQAAMAASSPVVIASNQSAIPVTVASTTVTNTVNIAGTTADGTTTETPILVVGGETSDATAQYQPIPLTASGVAVWVQENPTTLIISTVGTSGAAVTATLPAVAGQYHYITGIQVTRYATVVNTASATPVTITTTNIPGSLAFTVDNAADALGTASIENFTPIAPIKASVLNTATTVVCPATTGILWRINVFYFTAP